MSTCNLRCGQYRLCCWLFSEVQWVSNFNHKRSVQQSLLTCLKSNWIYPESSHEYKNIPSITISLMTKPCVFMMQSFHFSSYSVVFLFVFSFLLLYLLSASYALMPGVTNLRWPCINASQALSSRLIEFALGPRLIDLSLRTAVRTRWSYFMQRLL